jgi:hypothetical protein
MRLNELMELLKKKGILGMVLFGMNQISGLITSGMTKNDMKLENHYKVECYDKDKILKWVEEFDNIVVNAGLNYSLSIGLAAGAQITTWYVGLKGTGTVVLADTMSSHAGWTEDQTYSNATRPAWTPGAVSGQSVDNSASKAVFNINNTTTIYGAFMTSNNAKGGSTGTLYGAGDFGSSRAVINGDTLNVTVTCTAA